MNICQSLIEAARRSQKHLGGRRGRAIEILRSKQQADGGFCGKSKSSDLYYTGFAVLSLLAMGADFDFSKTIQYLHDYAFDERADLAHRAAWIRQCRLLIQGWPDERMIAQQVDALSRYRCSDGAWHHLGAEASGSAYGCFLYLGAMQDLGVAVEESTKQAIANCIDSLKTRGGGYFNEADIPAVSVPATAAAMVCKRVLGIEIRDADARQWLVRCFDGAGFRVMPIAPVADLLSTAVAVHALEVCGTDIEPIRGACLDFVNALWDDAIGFCANPEDRLSDTEYMFYGLLATGHLAT